MTICESLHFTDASVFASSSRGDLEAPHRLDFPSTRGGGAASSSQRQQQQELPSLTPPTALASIESASGTSVSSRHHQTVIKDELDGHDIERDKMPREGDEATVHESAQVGDSDARDKGVERSSGSVPDHMWDEGGPSLSPPSAAQSAGRYQVMSNNWGKFEVESFGTEEAARVYFDSISVDVAHRLTRDGVEIARHVYDDAPWPDDWTPPPEGSPSSAPQVGGVLGNAVEMSMGAKGGQAVLSAMIGPLVPAGGGTTSDSGRNVAGSEPSGVKGVAGQDAVEKGSDSKSEGGVSGKTGGDENVPRRISDQEAGVGGAVTKGGDRPDAASVGKAHRVDQNKYIKWREVMSGGGDMVTGVSITCHMTVDRMDRLQVRTDNRT